MRLPASTRLLHRFGRDQRGVTAVEFGVIAPALFLLVMGIVELGLMGAAQSVLDNAAFSASRVGKTGYASTGQTQAQTISAAVTKAAAGYLDASKISLTSLAYSDYGNIGQPEPFTDKNNNGKWDSGEAFTDVNGNGKWDADQGKSGTGTSAQIVVYTVTYSWKLFTPLISNVIGANGVAPLKSLIVVKNEPY